MSDFKHKILAAISKTKKPCLAIRFTNSMTYGQTAWIYFGISKIAMDENMFKKDIPEEDFMLDYSQQSDLMVCKLKDRYGEDYAKFVRLKNMKI